MLRVKVVQGILTGDQAEVLAWIAREHGRGMLDCTTRQCVRRWCSCPGVGGPICARARRRMPTRQ